MSKDDILNEAKATGENSVAADPVTPAGGWPKKRRADLFKKVNPTADDIEDDVKTPQGTNNAGLHEAISNLFEGEQLSEDFKVQVEAIFEAVINEKTDEIHASLVEEFEDRLAEQVSEITEDLTSKLDSYLEYAINEWKEENAVELESSYKVAVAESLFDSLKQVMAEHNIEIDENQSAVVSSMEEELATTTQDYNKLFEAFSSIKEENEELKKAIIFDQLSEDLAATDADRFLTLAENVEYTDPATFNTKLSAIKKAYFTESARPTNSSSVQMLEEEYDDTSDAIIADEGVSNYVKALNKLKI